MTSRDIINIGIISDTFTKLDDIAEHISKNAEILNINTTTSLETVDIIIIILNDDNWLLDTIDWLVAIQDYPSIFTWVISSKILNNQEEEILLKLGVISILKREKSFKNIMYSIKNTFFKARNKKIINENESIIFLEDNFISIEENILKITNIEYASLKYLYNNTNIILSYDDIYKQIWNTENIYNPKNSRIKIANIIFRLREILKDYKSFEIITVRNVGYMYKKKICSINYS